MKRLAILIGGAVFGVLVTGAGLYAATLLWPGLAGLGAAPTATTAATAAESARPTGTPGAAETAAPTRLPAPTAESPFLRELFLNATLTAAASAAPRAGETGGLSITRLSLQSPYEAQGFDFRYVQLGDGRDR